MTASRQESPLPPANAGVVHWRQSLRTRIALWSALINIVLLLALAVATAWFARRVIFADARRDTIASAQEAADRLDASLRAVAITTRGVSDLVANSDLDPQELTTTLRAMVLATPGCAGGLIVLEPDGERSLPYARYISARGPQRDRDFVADGFDYRRQGWYQRTLTAPDGWWSEPYRNETAGGVWMVTYNRPLRPRGKGVTTRGMVSLDLPLAELTRNFESLAHLPGWRVSLVAPAGTLATNPDVSVADNLTLDQFIRRSGRSDLLPTADAARLRQPLQLVHTDAITGETRFTVVEPVGETGWSLLVAQAYPLIIERLNQALTLLLGVGALLALVCTLLVRHLAKRISLPVEGITAAAASLASGNYDTPVPWQKRRDEVGLLGRTLEHARTSIRQQLDAIEEMSAARQKIESELAIAREIQLAMLPPARVIDQDDRHLEVAALLEPAKAVGGDFYSFIEGSDGLLWFAIGDVSDKGVPAALFMARTVTVLEVAARAGGSPSQVLAEASRRLVEGNDTCMFATVLFGQVDLRSGDIVLASAGHDAPLLLHADGRHEVVPMESGAPLGFEASSQFPTWRGRLPAGATLLAYTDGVTEAFNPGNEAFGLERLRATLRAELSALAHCEHVIANVHAFAHPAAQSDDITVLAMRLRQDAREPTSC
jgi:sigma-B regulation protein RsbU (phosphoserine phosphatase)